MVLGVVSGEMERI